MKLAVFTGKPFFDVVQHVGGPVVEPETRERFHRLCDEAFERNFLTNTGPFTLRLEQEVAARHKVKEAVFMANATLAQLILMKAMGIASGEAIVSANTFIATAHVCEWLGVRPVFCDLDPATLNLDPADCERKITPNTRIIIPTHVFGVFADMPALARIARRYGIHLMADAAHAFDCDLGGTPAGGFGVPEFLSFHATKYFSTLEGGAVLTNDRELAERMREFRNFGFDRPDDTGKLGVNAKGSEISAAFGLASLEALDSRRRLFKEIRDIYIEEFATVPGLRIHPVDDRGANNYRYFAMFVEKEFGLSRDCLFQALRRENIMVRCYFHPGCHRMSYYRVRFPAVVDSLPRTDEMLGKIICLPTSFVQVDPRRAARDVAALVRAMHEQAAAINGALSAGSVP